MSELKRYGLLIGLLALSACSHQPLQQAPSPEEVRAKVVHLLPPLATNRQGWAADIQVAFQAQSLDPSTENLCSVIAVIEQESNFQADPQVPGLGRIARSEIDRRAGRLHVPGFVVDAALGLASPTGKSYAQRIASVRSERELSEVFDDFISMAPLGRQLFGTFNPVHTGGPMQVAVDFAERNARGYPYPVQDSIRHEVFSRRGGVYFGTAHLLGYPVHYPEPLYRFADYNAGHYASRNAAFQAALNRLVKARLTLDGDLIDYGSLTAGQTELAVRSLGTRLGMSDIDIRRALDKGEQLEFEDTRVYQRVFELADQVAGQPVPRAILPGITLESPKITRHLTTAWFARRVDERRARCMARN
ncbi:DUF1615 domain-containing protein [Pseudomonas eucalypticola]|uniref:DUF1615 domain-containing protein n=1 Tax=Pseudomonas eucalypticola TaxID=2599595 RepID=A0A7D5D6Z2_9PSED|nr:DUF1615 domain-containing protein [Pseudomonas eucalypticola]QKZ04276.1 DUF1615 domain-containing protein [Pseudomonas eucalypticola]